MSFGILPNGSFYNPSDDEIRDFIEDQANIIFEKDGQKPDLQPTEIVGMISGLLRSHLRESLDRQENIYYNSFISTAQKAALDRVMYPTIRRGAVKSGGSLVFSGGAPGGTIPKATPVEREDGAKYFLLEDLILDGSGDGTGVAQAELAGIDYNSSVGTIRFLPVKVSGMPDLTVTNPSPFTGGLEVEGDDDSRERAKNNNSIDATSSLPALEQAGLNIENVTDVRGVDNQENVTVNGIPPGGIALTFRGGTDEDIANMLYGRRPAGNKSYGSESYDIIDPVTGYLLSTERFSRVQDIDIYVELNLTIDASYNPSVSDPVIKQRVLDYIGGVNPDNETSLGLTIGEDVRAKFVESTLYEIEEGPIAGLIDYTAFISITPSPITDTVIAINDDQEAITDFSFITINTTP